MCKMFREIAQTLDKDETSVFMQPIKQLAFALKLSYTCLEQHECKLTMTESKFLGDLFL